MGAEFRAGVLVLKIERAEVYHRRLPAGSKPSTSEIVVAARPISRCRSLGHLTASSTV